MSGECGEKSKDLIFYNVRINNCRGEMLYVGGSSEKTLIKNCIFSYSNSSTVSMSADIEIVDYGQLPRSERKSKRVFDNRDMS